MFKVQNALTINCQTRYHTEHFIICDLLEGLVSFESFLLN